MYNEDEVRRAEKLFAEFEGEPVLEEETALRHRDADFVVQKYKKVPVNFGMEFEQDKTDWGIPFEDTSSKSTFFGYEFWADFWSSSAPIEIALPISKGEGNMDSMRYPGRQIHQFIKAYRAYKRSRGGAPHEWSGERGNFGVGGTGQGFGCHIHFSARTDEPYSVDFPYRLADNKVDAWTSLYNTLVEVVPFLRILFAWGYNGVFAHRHSLERWSGDKIRRYSWDSARDIVEYPYTFSENKSKSVNFHPADRETGKGLTVEMRMNEAHPAVTYYSAIILNRIYRKVIETRWGDETMSPKLATDESCAYIRGLGKDRNRLFEWLTDASVRSYDLITDTGAGTNYQSLYDIYSEVKDIKFQEGRGIPGVGEEFDDMIDLFDRILIAYTPTFPPLARIGWFYLHHCDPWLNPYDFWDIFKPVGEFDWSGVREYNERV